MLHMVVKHSDTYYILRQKRPCNGTGTPGTFLSLSSTISVSEYRTPREWLLVNTVLCVLRIATIRQSCIAGVGWFDHTPVRKLDLL